MKTSTICPPIHGHMLVTGMILTSMISILALSGISSALIESQLASGFRQQDQLFQRAESGLRYVETLVLPNLDFSSGKKNTDRGFIEFEIPIDVNTTSEFNQVEFANPIVEVFRLDVATSKVRGKNARKTNLGVDRFRIISKSTRSDGMGGISLSSVLERKSRGVGDE